MSAPLLAVENLSKHYRLGGGRVLRALEGVSFTLAQGEVLGVVGESGSGKTTLGRTVLRLTPASGGSIRLRGQELAGLSRRALRPVRRQMQLVFQDPYGSLNPRMTVEQIVALPLRVHEPALGRDARRARVEAVLERTGLAKVARERACDLAYAEAKFLSLARVLVTQAPIWLLDEPASGLDPASRERFCALLREAAAGGVTICLIEHNLDIVAALADRIAFLDRGRKLAEGEPAAILRDPELAAIYFGERRG